MKSIKTFLLSATLVAGFGILLVGNDAHADTVYTVKTGDTLSSISNNVLGSNEGIERIVAANNIANRNLIYVGQQLTIPTDGEVRTQQTQSSAATTSQAQTAPSQSTNTASASTSSNYTSSTSGSDAAAKEWIANRESSGSYTAQNGQYYGRYQLTSSYLNGDYSAANQEKVADQYVASRYGSWSAAKSFWLANGWY